MRSLVLAHSVENPLCQGCGRPLFASDGQTLIMPTVWIAVDPGEGMVVSEVISNGWCGNCVESWNTRLAS